MLDAQSKHQMQLVFIIPETTIHATHISPEGYSFRTKRDVYNFLCRLAPSVKHWTARKFPQNTLNKNTPEIPKCPSWVFFGFLGVFSWGSRTQALRVFFRYFLSKFQVGPSRGSAASRALSNINRHIRRLHSPRGYYMRRIPHRYFFWYWHRGCVNTPPI